MLPFGCQLQTDTCRAQQSCIPPPPNSPHRRHFHLQVNTKTKEYLMPTLGLHCVIAFPNEGQLIFESGLPVPGALNWYGFTNHTDVVWNKLELYATLCTGLLPKLTAQCQVPHHILYKAKTQLSILGYQTILYPYQEVMHHYITSVHLLCDIGLERPTRVDLWRSLPKTEMKAAAAVLAVPSPPAVAVDHSLCRILSWSEETNTKLF